VATQAREGRIKNMDINLSELKQIRNEPEYNAVMARIEELFDIDEEESNKELSRLVILAEDYELEHFPIDPPSPEEAKAFRMEQELAEVDKYEIEHY
jgi:HTH-type transcriptional regulator/antitoxin HigA